MELDALYSLLCRLNPAKKFFVGYSGGLDSHVLLHSVAKLRELDSQFQLTAIHVNHQISPHASNWALHCRKICAELNIPCIVKVLPQGVAKKNIEATLRQLRYETMTSFLDEQSSLLTAHTQNDQAETLMLQLIRGAGVKGLAAMPLETSLGIGKLIRPFLTVTRQQLNQYALQNQLQWIEDESNDDLHFERNFLRKKIMPLLQTRWPSINENLSRSAQHCAEADWLLSEFAEMDLANAVNNNDMQLNLEKIKDFSLARKKNMLRQWLLQLKLPLPSQAQLQQLVDQTCYAKEAANVLVTWPGVAVRRYQNGLYINSHFLVENKEELNWELHQELVLPNQLGKLSATLQQEKGLLAAQHQRVTVRFRQESTRCQPQGRQGSHPLKKLFQEWQVPPWQRNQIPLLYIEDQLAVVVGYCVCENFATEENQEGYLIQRFF